jgi:hypothetical protein
MMHQGFFATFAASAGLSLMCLGVEPVHGQAPSRQSHRAEAGTVVRNQLAALSHARGVRWREATEVLRCAPAPLTERPGIVAEFARPRVSPLESAFADAARIKRPIANLRFRPGS